MDAPYWDRVTALFQEALEHPVDRRAAFLADACAGVPGLLRDVEALLDADARPHSLLDGGAQAALPVSGPGLPEGTRMGPWRLGGKIGQGGMGAVYLAERADGAYRQRVALKLLSPGLVSERLLRRFEEERRILARLEHPGIARLVDGGSTGGGMPGLAMEYVDGRPIDAWCDERRLPVDDRLRLFLSVCDAVRYAHGRLDRPPGPEAGQHPRRRGWRRSAAGEAPRGGGGGAHPYRGPPHDAGLREPGADARQGGLHRHRRLLPRRAPLRAPPSSGTTTPTRRR